MGWWTGFGIYRTINISIYFTYVFSPCFNYHLLFSSPLYYKDPNNEVLVWYFVYLFVFGVSVVFRFFFNCFQQIIPLLIMKLLTLVYDNFHRNQCNLCILCDQAENKCHKFMQVSPITNKNRHGNKMSRETGILKQNTTFFSWNIIVFLQYACQFRVDSFQLSMMLSTPISQIV